MAEAIISRPGIGGGDVEISNETKSILGLNNNATLDDCLQSLGLKDPNYATIIATLKDVDGTPIQNANIRMTTNTSITYTTDSSGMCTFKTNYGSATLSDIATIDYIDLQTAESKRVDCLIGEVYRVDLQRRTRGNGYNMMISSNRNVKFSKYLNNVTVGLYSAGGGGGFSNIGLSGHRNCTVDLEAGVTEYVNGANVFQYNRASIYSYNLLSGGNFYRGESGGYKEEKIDITPDMNYNCIIGRGGRTGWMYYATSRYAIRVGYRSITTGNNDPIIRNVTFNSSNRIEDSWFNPYVVNGTSGGTTSFGGILSIAGGAGIVYQSTGNGASNSGCPQGSYNTQLSTNINHTVSTTSRGNNCIFTVNIRINQGSNNNYAQNGYIWLNNFQYK